MECESFQNSLRLFWRLGNRPLLSARVAVVYWSGDWREPMTTEEKLSELTSLFNSLVSSYETTVRFSLDGSQYEELATEIRRYEDEASMILYGVPYYPQDN